MRNFRCPDCGHIINIYPPDDTRTTVSLDKPKPEYVIGKVIKKIVDCPNCNTSSTLYWYRELIGTRVLS